MDFEDFSDEDGHTESMDNEEQVLLTTIKAERDDVADPLGGNYEIFDIQRVLRKWGLQQETINRLLFCGIKTEAHLRRMHHHHIDDIFKKDELIGEKIIFTGKLQNWRQMNEYSPLGCCSLGTKDTTMDPRDLEDLDHPDADDSIPPDPFPDAPPEESFNLDKILRKTPQGKQIMLNNTKNGHLSFRDQTTLCRIIIDYHININPQMTRYHFEQYSISIIKLFPKESIKTYYNPGRMSNAKQRTGLLYERYRMMSAKAKQKKDLKSTGEKMNGQSKSKEQELPGSQSEKESQKKQSDFSNNEEIMYYIKENNQLLKELHKKFDKWEKRMKDSGTTSASSSTSTNFTPRPSSPFKGIPIDTIDEMNQLNFDLGDKDNAQEFISKMCEYNGYSGKLKGSDVAASLIKIIFTPHLLAQFSWTGFSRSENPKSEFRNLTIFMECFYQVVKSADSTFTKQDLELIIKQRLKHGNKFFMLSQNKNKDTTWQSYIRQQDDNE